MEKSKGVRICIGGGFLSMLAVLFIGLKLCGVIDWSWWLVLSPLYLWAFMLIAFVFLVLIVSASTAMSAVAAAAAAKSCKSRK